MVPDADWEQTVLALLGKRHQALGMRSIEFELVRHPYRDPGVRTNAAALLRPFVGRAEFCIAVMDLEGSGALDEHSATEEIEHQLADEWGDFCAAVVVSPELEAWVWASSPHVQRVLGWTGRLDLRQHLANEGKWALDEAKPPRPKETMQEVMRLTRKRRSPAIYGELASSVSLANCSDPGFLRFRSVLQEQFPPDS